ncbi:hypothetical protein N656DRAFT_675842, partial [Canariomyces notabilis]
LGQDQYQLLANLHRGGGLVSFLSVISISLLYARFRRLQTLPNTLIIYSCFGTGLAAISCLIGNDGAKQGLASPLCQTQGFLLEVFMLSAPSWALAMSVNTLVMFHIRQTAGPDTLRKLAWLYCLPCYGGPFTVALTFLFLREPQSAPIYGKVDTWCWISREWQSLRLYGCYIPAWAFILVSVLIYCAIAVQTIIRGSSEGQTENHKLGAAGSPAMARRSYLSLSDWTLSSPAHDMPFELPGCIAPPMPTYTATPLSHRSTWLGNFGRCPRPAPLPPCAESISEKELAIPFITPDSANRAQLHTGLLFAISVTITWLPGTIQHIQELRLEDSSFAVKAATATLLPLQGLWTAVIFFVTSWTVIR